MNRRPRSWTDSELREAVDKSYSLREVLQTLNLVPADGNYQHVRQHINRLRLPTAHWRRIIKPPQPASPRPLSELLVENSPLSSTNKLGKRLIAEGVLPSKCSEPMCEVETVWLGKQITLHLDHKNGRRTDNRLENLRLLCPNCHSQTETYCGRNINGGSKGILATFVGLGRCFESTVAALGLSEDTVRKHLRSEGVKLDRRRRQHRINAKAGFKILWPPKFELEKLVQSLPILAIAARLGVSDVAVAKHCRKVGIPLPGRGFWAKKNKGKAYNSK